MFHTGTRCFTDGDICSGRKWEVSPCDENSLGCDNSSPNGARGVSLVLVDDPNVALAPETANWAVSETEICYYTFVGTY